MLHWLILFFSTYYRSSFFEENVLSSKNPSQNYARKIYNTVPIEPLFLDKDRHLIGRAIPFIGIFSKRLLGHADYTSALLVLKHQYNYAKTFGTKPKA